MKFDPTTLAWPFGEDNNRVPLSQPPQPVKTTQLFALRNTPTVSKQEYFHLKVIITTNLLNSQK